MRVVFMGTPDFAVPILRYLLLNGYRVAAVYTQPDKPAGRGRSLAISPVKRAALEYGLPVVQPASLKTAEAAAQLAAYQPDIIIVAAYGQILPPAILEIPGHRCVNVHGSLLPKYRGAAPIPAAILAGDAFTGVSIMLMEAGLDTGPVLARAQLPITAQDTTGSLTVKLARIGASLLGEAVTGWWRGEVTPHPQNETEATYCRPISKDAGEIDWQLPAAAIWRRVRAYQPWPGCFTRWRGKQLKIIEAAPLAADTAAEPGRVVALEPPRQGTAFGINSGDGLLGVVRVQLEGKQEMSGTDFLRGQRQFIGATLPG